MRCLHRVKTPRPINDDPLTRPQSRRAPYRAPGVRSEAMNGNGLSAMIARLRAVVGERWTVVQEHELRTYESDGLLQYKALPAVAVLPADGDEVRRVVALC